MTRRELTDEQKQRRKEKAEQDRVDGINAVHNIKSPTRSAKGLPKPKWKPRKKPAKTSPDIRKAPRSSRSKTSRRWKDWRESDGVISEVITYKVGDSNE